VIEVLPIFGESAAAVDPTDGAFNNPAFGQNDKALELVGMFDDFRFEARQDGRQRGVKDWPLIRVMCRAPKVSMHSCGPANGPLRREFPVQLPRLFLRLRTPRA
jgi:hypothetical protein